MTGEYKITGGSKYINLVEGQSPPGMITWNGELPANFVTIESLMQRLFEISETCKLEEIADEEMESSLVEGEVVS